jgi:chromate transporter
MTASSDAPPSSGAVTLAEAARVWIRIAALSFGGPAGQISVMHRIVVEEKKWISEERFLHALNYCMLLPGPEAQQLATYLGWSMHGTLGGLIAGGLFILPGAVAIMALSVVYAVFGSVGVVASIFFGLKAAVLAIVLQAVHRLGKNALRTPASEALAATAFLALFFFAVPFPLVVASAGVLGFVFSNALVATTVLQAGRDKEKDEKPLSVGLRQSLLTTLLWLAIWLTPLAVLWMSLGADNVFVQIGALFSKMAVVTFGGAYAALAYVAQQAVEPLHWLAPREMLDGLGMAETTPGPLIMVLQFVGFMAAYRQPGALSPVLAGVMGGLLASWATFAPCFLWIFVGAPYIERLRGNAALTGALSAITAAVVGVIVNLAVWFAIHAIFARTTQIHGFGFSFEAPSPASLDWRALALTVAAVIAIFEFRLGILQTLASCSLAGLAFYLIGGLGS